MNESANKTPAYLIDASVFVFRSYYSMPDTFFDARGESINAVYGFARFLTRFIQHNRPQHLAVAFDESLSTSFRNDIYAEYKANREPAPESLKKQFSRCREVAEALGIQAYSDHSYEADDIIGTLAERLRQRGHPVVLVSADKDLAQLLQPGDLWWDFGKADPIDHAGVVDKMGVMPEQVVDYLALAGDAVDNIPGVPGVGPKTAIALLQHFGSLEAALERAKEIQFLSFRGAKSSMQKLLSHRDQALLSQKLSRIITDVPIEDDDIIKRSVQPQALQPLFDALNPGPMLRRQLQEAAVYPHE